MTEQEEINACLNCTFPECINCLSKGGRVYFKHEEWKKRIREYSKLGFTDKEMAKLLGCHPNTVAKLRTAIGLTKKEGVVRVGRPKKNKNVQNPVRQ